MTRTKKKEEKSVMSINVVRIWWFDDRPRPMSVLTWFGGKTGKVNHLLCKHPFAAPAHRSHRPSTESARRGLWPRNHCPTPGKVALGHVHQIWKIRWRGSKSLSVSLPTKRCDLFFSSSSLLRNRLVFFLLNVNLTLIIWYAINILQ